MMRPSIATVLALLSSIHLTNAQTPDGAIVPFSTLPACAAFCGPLYDVQGACAPPHLPAVDDNCFCTDARLTPFTQSGTTGVSQVCGAASCSKPEELQALQSWYTSFCAKNKGATPTTTTKSSASGSKPTSSSSSSNSNGGSSSGGNSNGIKSTNSTWFSTHYKWVIMLVVIVVVIVGTWIAACVFRRRYLRNKEREIEMLPPIALGPHQLQAMTGGYRYGDGIVDNNRLAPAHSGGHHKEMTLVEATKANATRHSNGLIKKALMRKK